MMAAKGAKIKENKTDIIIPFMHGGEKHKTGNNSPGRKREQIFLVLTVLIKEDISGQEKRKTQDDRRGVEI